MKKQFLSKSVPRGTRTIWRYLGALFILFTFAIGNVWGADVYYIVCNKAKLPLTAGMSGSSAQLLKLDGSTLSTTTDISIATSGSVGEKLYYNSTTATYAALTTTSNYSSGQTSSRTMSGFDLGGSNSQLTIKCGSKSYSKLDVIYSCNSNDKKSISIAGTSYETSDKNIHLASISNVTGDIVINNNSGKNYYVFAVLTYTSGGECTVDPAAPTKFEAGSITEDGVTFSITDAANAGKYDIYYSTSSTAPEATTAASATSTAKTKAITGLTASTRYYAWVRSVCDESHKSDWVALTGGFFTTAAPDPCATHHWFVATADATSNGVTNWNGFTNGVTGSSGQTNSVTIDGTTYSLTKRTGSTTGTDGIILGFTIPANKAGTLYGYMKSSGTGARTLSLKKGDEVVKTNTQISNGDWTLITIDAIAPGTYTLSPDQNVQVQMFVLKVCDAEFHTITLDLDGGTGTTSISALDGAPATKPADPTKENADFVKWVVKSTGNDYDWTSNVTGDLTLKAVWSQWPKLTLEAGEGATGDAVVSYHKAGSSVAVPAKPEGFSNGTSSFTGWVYSSDVEITDGAFPMPSSDLTLTAQWASATAVAQIVGGDSYETFAAAIAAVTDGQTIQLLQDIDVDAQIEIAGVDITIDLNGHKIEYVGDATLPSGVILVHNGASLTINDSNDPSAGSVVSGEKAYAAVALTKLGDDASNPATLVVNGGALTGYYYGITGNGSRNNTVITINGGTITGTVGIAIYHPQVGTLTVNDGNLTGEDAAIEMRAGTLVINDGTFTATATEFSCNPNGSGSTTSGAAIAIAQHTTKKEISVTINGGTFNGVKAINESNPQVNDPAPEVAMEIKDGDFNGEVTTVDVNNFISGGTFDHEVAANQCAEGYAPEDNGDGTYGVKPLATSIDFVAFIDANGTSGSWATYLSDHNYTISSTSDVSLDGGNNGAADKGLKIKKTGRTITFDVAAGKLVTLKVGSLDGGAQISENGGEFVALTGANPLHTGASVKTYYYSADVANYVIKTVGDAYNIIQSVTIEDPYVVTFYANGGEDVAAMEFQGTALTLPSATKGTEVFKGWYDAAEDGNLIGKAGESYTPTADITLHAQWEAVSSDATLSALEVDEATVAGFDPDIYIYNIVCEYGQQPMITKATATAGTLATVTINNTPVDEGTYKYVQVKVVPQSGEEGKKFYQVRYTNLPKKGVSLIKATHTGAKTADVTGYLGGTYDKNTASDGKLGDANTYFGIKLAEGNFQAGDVLYIHANTVSSAVRIYSDKGTTRINAEDGTFDANKMFTYTLTAETEWIYIYRKVKDGESDMNPYVDYIEVQRYMDPFIESFEIEGIGALDINPTTKAITASVPESFDVTALTPTIKAWANGSAHLDKSGPQNFTNSVTYKVTSDYDEDGEVTYTVTITKVAPSATPTITTQPVSANYVEGASINALTVVAESTAGELSYQWQVKNGLEFEDIDGATAASYTPAISAIGSYTYRVVVTNTEESKPATSVNSNDATITIAADPSCATFVAASIPTAEPYQYTNTGEWTIYNASSSGKRNGADQVFGDVKDFEGNTVKGFAKERCVLIFEKDMKQIRFYSANAQRAWGETPVRVSDDVETFLGTGTPSYSEYAATTSLIQADPSNNKEQIFIANGEFLAGKCYWFAFSGSLQIFQICAVEADPKADAPVFANVLADEAICEGETFATLNATASPVTSYAWYKDGVVIDGAEAATYTPTEAGTYYCIATNAQAGHRPNSLKSAEAVLSVKAAASVTMANVSGKATASIALNAVATGANPHYAWFTCDDAEGNNAVAIPGAADAASYAIPTPVATQYYKVVVTTDCGNASAVALVTLLPDIVPLADVTESTVWDWSVVTKVADGSDLSGNGPTVTTGDGLVIANYLQGDDFDKIEGNNGAYSIRSSSNKFYQGASLHFHSTKGGYLTIRARNEGHAMTLKVENEGRDMNLGDLGNWKNYTIYVKAGDVTIYNVPAEGTYPMRVEKITFTVKESPDYTRDVTNNIGTLCVDHNVVAGGFLGATFYQIASRNETYPDKIDFEEVMPGEELKAGEPYIFQSTTGKIELFYGETVESEPVEVRGMIGTYSTYNLPITEENMRDIIYISGNKLHNCIDLLSTGLNVVANRAYIKLSGVPTYADYHATATPVPGRRRVTLGGPDQVPTAIDNAEASEAPRKVMINGELFIIRGEKMYDGTGRLVK